MSEPGSHPALELDELVHQKTRLALLTVLDEAGRADFPYLKRLLGLTDGNLGRHLQALAHAALAAEMDVLAELVHRFRTARDGKREDPDGD